MLKTREITLRWKQVGWSCCVLSALALTIPDSLLADPLLAGASKVDVTDWDAGPVDGPMHVRALVLRTGETTAVLITVDSVAIGEIGRISNSYMSRIREQLKQEWDIAPTHVLANASHCHGVIRQDIEDLTVQAVREAMQRLEPVRVGVGRGREDRVMENRRLKLKDGRTVDIRRAYSLPPDEEIAAVGPVDPEIGILRLDRLDGTTLAIVYNFACHPIQGVPGGRNTADMTGFASQVIEDNLSDGAIALFVQGCGGDINPANYKAVDQLLNAESLGNMLGLSTLKAARRIQITADSRLRILHERLALPRANTQERIMALEAEQTRLLNSLQGTTLNLKSFMSLVMKYNLAQNFPSSHSYRYLQEDALEVDDLRKLDAQNRVAIKSYLANIHVMEELTRLRTNLRLLKKHQSRFLESGKRTVDVELVGMRIGDFTMVTFPGELTVQIGLNIKRSSPHKHTFVAGYTNGYIYYAPTADQLLNVGGAQEDSDCVLAPEWQEQFERKVAEMLPQL